MTSRPPEVPLTRYAWVSVAVAIATMALKGVAYLLTGSVGLLSDAAESLVNLIGGIMALSMLIVAARPEDDDHAYGHTKAEYFSSGIEGGLILLAAASIAGTAFQRLWQPQPLQQIGLGLIVSVAASGLNLAAALLLLRVGRARGSVTLEANARHLLTDVWTSVGVVAAIGLVAVTGWEILDPLVALAVAGNIVWTGFRILRSSALGLMDTALPEEEREKIRQVVEQHCTGEIQYHALRTRQAGRRRFVSFHVLVPGNWTVHQGHAFLEKIEADIRAAVPQATVFTHLESLEDASSWDDTLLDR